MLLSPRGCLGRGQRGAGHRACSRPCARGPDAPARAPRDGGRPGRPREHRRHRSARRAASCCRGRRDEERGASAGRTVHPDAVDPPRGDCLRDLRGGGATERPAGDGRAIRGLDRDQRGPGRPRSPGARPSGRPLVALAPPSRDGAAPRRGPPGVGRGPLHHERGRGRARRLRRGPPRADSRRPRVRHGARVSPLHVPGRGAAPRARTWTAR